MADKMKTPTLGPCGCKRGQQRDNCPQCEGTGQRINFPLLRLQIAMEAARAKPGAKWTPETGWTDAALKERAEYEQWRHKERPDNTEAALHAEAMSLTSNLDQ